MVNENLASAVRDAARINMADLTIDMLRQQRPDIVTAIESAVDVKPRVDAARTEGEAIGRLAGAAEERTRLAAIDKLMPVGMEALRDEMKADVSVTPEKAAVRFLEASNLATENRMQGLKDADRAVAVPAAPTATGAAADQPAKLEGEAAWKAEFAKGDTGFSTEADYIAFKKADARGGVKILQGKAAA